MAGATLAELRAGIETRLATIPNVVTSAYMLDNPPDLTLQVMGPDQVDYDQAAARGHDNWVFVVQGFSGSPASQAAQMNLDEWLAPTGTNSVKAAIEGDRSLGGIVDDCWVRSASGYREYELPNRGRVLGAEWTLLILNSGT